MTGDNKMGTKTFRIEKELADKASDKAIEYISKNKEMITESQIINASIRKGIEKLSDEDIRKHIESKN